MGRVRKAVVPAAGRGTRLLPLTASVPKELLPVGPQPMIRHAVEELASNGIEEMFFVLSPAKESLRLYLERLRTEGPPFSGCRFFFGVQPEPTGIPFAVSAAREFTGGERFVLAMPDTLLLGPSPTRQLLDAAGDPPGGREHMGALARVSRRRLSGFGYGGGIEWERTGPRRYEVRRFEGGRGSLLRGAGRILLGPEVFPFIAALSPSTDETTDLRLYERMRTAGHRFTGLRVRGRLHDLGTLRGYREANGALCRTHAGRLRR